MKPDSNYKIEFAGLKIGNHQFNFNADKKFFNRFNFSDFNDVSVNIDIELIKKSTLIELEFALKGVASTESFLCSIYLAIDVYRRRKIYDEFSKNKLETSQ